ncbi:MAG TPA: ABC transporter ATP-binding protein [Blastocatellia bacterium]|nr:ABC transporter ATP-binding protein [Blastocatellia bacterium]
MIRLVDVSFRVGTFELQSINLEVQSGEYFAILGPTGAGKTKLLEIIAGIESPASGEVWIDDQNVTALPPERRRVGFMYQDYLLFPHLTVRKNIMFGLHDKTRSEKARRVDEISQLLGIQHLLTRRVSGLSGGEQQRIALARALAPQPRALLLDEPLSALDPKNRASVRTELTSLQKRLGTTTIHVTHDFEEALVVAERVAIINKGEIVQLGSTEEVINRPNSAFVADFFGSENLFKGEIARRDAATGSEDVAYNAVFKTASLQLTVIAERDGTAYAMIRPEDIIVSTEVVHSSATNNLKGRIVKVEAAGPLVRLTADVGVRLVALLTKQSLASLKLDTESEAYFSIKAAAIHIF